MSIDKFIFLIWMFWFFYDYGPNIFVTYLINLYNNSFIGEEFDDENEELEKNEEKQVEKPKYEDKYLSDIRQLNKEWIFTNDENNQIPTLVNDFFNSSIENKQIRIQEINNEIEYLDKKIYEDVEYVNDFNDIHDDEDNEDLSEDTKDREEKIKLLQEELEQIKFHIESEEGKLNLKRESENHANQFIINKRLEKLHNCFVMEKTPIGNVLMIYDKSKETFKYYSDCTIPYRYLEVVGRKYVKLFGCRPIFIDMEEELRLFEEKWEKDQELKKLKEDEEKKKLESLSNINSEVKKKNVFAKFKSYNKEAGGKISMAAPPKNNIPNKSINEIKENEKILLKERANRYTYEGKIANFNFLQKIERKVFNKRLGLSFADFKKMQRK